MHTTDVHFKLYNRKRFVKAGLKLSKLGALSCCIVQFSVAETNFADAVSGATMEGSTSGGLTTFVGRHSNGSGYEFSTKALVTTKPVDGYSVSFGANFSAGSSGNGKNTDDNAKGSTITRTSDADFGISNLYFTKKFDDGSYVRLGSMGIKSDFTSSSSDRGVGVLFNVQSLDFAKFNFAMFDSWVTSGIYGYSAISTDNKKVNGVGNNLFIANVSGDVKDVGLSYGFSSAYSYNYINYLGAANVKYSTDINNSNIELYSELFFAFLADKPVLYTGFGQSKSIDTKNLASSRGLFNLGFRYKVNDVGGGISVKAGLGYATSFLDGYGVVLGGSGSSNIVKQYSGSFMGLTLIGPGSYKGSRVGVLYGQVATEYGDLKANLDFNYVINNNIPTDSLNEQFVKDTTKVGVDSSNKSGSFVEVAPSVSYKLASGLDLKLTYAQLFGTINAGRAAMNVKYSY